MTERINGSKFLTALREEQGIESPALSTKTVERIFAKLAAIYGNKFVDHWASVDQDELKSTWAEALGHLSVDELRNGFAMLVQSGSAFPPTLPEFFQACRPRIDVPPVTDQAGLDRLSKALGIKGNPQTYHELRQICIEAARQHSAMPSNVRQIGAK